MGRHSSIAIYNICYNGIDIVCAHVCPIRMPNAPGKASRRTKIAHYITRLIGASQFPSAILLAGPISFALSLSSSSNHRTNFLCRRASFSLSHADMYIETTNIETAEQHEMVVRDILFEYTPAPSAAPLILTPFQVNSTIDVLSDCRCHHQCCRCPPHIACTPRQVYKFVQMNIVSIYQL